MEVLPPTKVISPQSPLQALTFGSLCLAHPGLHSSQGAGPEKGIHPARLGGVLPLLWWNHRKRGPWGSSGREKAGRAGAGPRPSAKLFTPPHSDCRDSSRRENSFSMEPCLTALRLQIFLRRSTPLHYCLLPCCEQAHKLCCKRIPGGRSGRRGKFEERERILLNLEESDSEKRHWRCAEPVRALGVRGVGNWGDRGNQECFFCFIMFTDPEFFCSTSFDERSI